MAHRYPDLRRAAAHCLVFAVFAALSASAGSASASTIVFDCYTKLCRVPAGGGPVQTIGPSGAGSPALSPDGRHLAYEYADGVYLGDADASNSHLVAQPQGDVSDLVWRRDSGALLWRRYVSGLGNFVCRLVLGQSPQCSNFTGTYPTWGPSDQRLLRTDPDASKTICVATFTGQCRRTVAVAQPPRYYSEATPRSGSRSTTSAPLAGCAR
jgi:hypothetical protein